MQDGHWEGEIWDRRKNGEVFPAWLAISVVRDKHGSISRYIGVLSNISEQKKAQETIYLQANYDELTMLPNRRLFLDRLDQEIKKARRDKTQVALIFIDLDNFKEINDTFGHEWGDKLLNEAAQRIQACVREVDTVARLGGDEFTVVLPYVSSSRDADRVSVRADQLQPRKWQSHGALERQTISSIRFPTPETKGANNNRWYQRPRRVRR